MFNTTSTLMRFGSNFPLNQSLFSSSKGGKYSSLFTTRKHLLVYPCSWNQVQFKAFASRKSETKRKNDRKATKEGTLTSKIISADGYKESADTDSNDGNNGHSACVELLNENADAAVRVASSSRAAVLQACTITSVLLAALGVAIRQASHLAYAKGWANFDSTEVAFGFEMWHIELIVGLVILISTSRFILLKIWPEFAESSDAANQQILSSLQPLDYLVVALLPGISENMIVSALASAMIGIALSRGSNAAFRAQLDERPRNRRSFRSSSRRWRPEIFVRRLGNICRLRLRRSDRSFLEPRRSDGVAFAEQSRRRPLMALLGCESASEVTCTLKGNVKCVCKFVVYL